MIKFYDITNGIKEASSLGGKQVVVVDFPDSKDERFLLEELQIPEAFYSDINDINERPRIEYEDDWGLIILRVPFKTSDEKLPFNTAPLGIIFNENYAVLITFEQTEIIQDFILHINRKKLNINGFYDLVLKLHLSSSVWFLKYLKQIDFQIKVAENNLEKSVRNEDLQTLLELEKCLVFFVTSLKGNDILYYRMLKHFKNQEIQYDLDLIEDVEIELRQAQETTHIYSDILSGMMDAYASVISNNLNIVMKRLTSISILLMIPTLIASFFGMNVINGLENSKYAFLFILLISFGLSVIGIILFKFKKWF